MSFLAPEKKRQQIGLLLASTLTVMAGATVAPSLPQIEDTFSGTQRIDLLSRLVLTLPALFIGVASPLAGWLIDRFGRLRLLYASMVLYALAGTSGLYLQSIEGILAGRAVLGLAVAGIMTTVTTLAADYLQGESRGKFMGIQGGFMALGGMVFILMGGGLADVHWRAPFGIYAFSLVFLFFISRRLYEPSQQERTNPTQSKTPGQGPSDVAGQGSRWKIALVYATAFLGMVLFYMMPVQIPYLVKEFPDVSNTQAGLAIAIGTVTGALVSLNYKRFRQRLHFAALFFLSFLFMGGGYVIIGLAPSYLLVLAGVLVAGLGAGFLMPNANVWLMGLAPPEKRGRLMGGLSMAIFLGQFASPLVTEPVEEAYQSLSATFLVAAGVLGIGALGYLLLAIVQKQNALRKPKAQGKAAAAQ